MNEIKLVEIADELDCIISLLKVLQAAITNNNFNEIGQSAGVVLEEIIGRIVIINRNIQSKE